MSMDPDMEDEFEREFADELKVAKEITTGTPYLHKGDGSIGNLSAKRYFHNAKQKVENSGNEDSSFVDCNSQSRVSKCSSKGAHVTVTSTECDRVYLRLKPANVVKTSLQARYRPQSGVQLLSIPFSDLKDLLEEERQRKLTERSNLLLHSLRSSVAVFENEGTEAEGLHRESSEHLLWVEKYSPKHYTELLSDDGINRTLLSWLKLWDKVVFGHTVAVKSRTNRELSTSTGHKGQNAKKAQQGRKLEVTFEYRNPGAFSVSEALDDTGRPNVKLALLCGAPGLGKTTLAHIISKHAGYNVVEMNASDDRSPEMFAQKIESATQMQAVLTPNTKPNCLIIDEIDGAPTAAIHVLLEIVKKNPSKTKKKGGSPGLSRPIICICNDQYASSLRQLKQHCLLLYFPPIVTARLASRLHQIIKLERMSAAMSTLMALCEKADNDVRSCLNTLQFLGQKQKNITLALVQGANVGQKDARRSLFSLWKEIFQLSVTKKHTLNQGPLKLAGDLSNHNSLYVEGCFDVNLSRYRNILWAALATGENDKVAGGLFENYLSVRFKDPNLEAVSSGQDWIVFHDELQQHIAHSQNFIFAVYFPYVSVAFHFLYAAPSKPTIHYPNTAYEVFLQQRKNSNLLISLLNEVPPSVRRMITSRLLSVEILPPLTDILSPSFRPVSTQLYSSHERQQLLDLVGTMISYNLTFRQDQGQDGHYTYALEPNIAEVTHFSGLPQKKQLLYSTKQLIAREIEVEKLRRADVSVKRNEKATKKTDDVPTYDVDVKSHNLIHQRKQESRLEELHLFQRKSLHRPKRTGSVENSSFYSLWFKFNEGFSNAVRRPVRVKDLL